MIRNPIQPAILGLVLAIALAACGAAETPPDPAPDAAAEVAETTDEVARAIRPNPIDVEGSASLGPADAPVTLVEYSDFQ